MCGIAGYVGGGFGPKLLSELGERLAYRGPDGHGFWHDAAAGVGFAHRRLSLIDLSEAASQPMQAVEGRYTIVFNGEIYNFKSLVPELRARGYRFNENSDTAVLCPLYDAYGPAMLDRLEGMFAFAIWDGLKHELFVARDHAGIKPFYYANTAKGFVFASEAKALLGVEGVDLGADALALADYLTFLWSPSERTMRQGVKKLRPGHCLKVKKAGKGAQVEIARWYYPPQAPLERGRPVYDRDKTPEQLAELFDFVVKEQCTADVPPGAFLSGGVDSSAIVASMCRGGFKPKEAYCISFAGAGMASEGFGEDIDFAREVAAQYDVKLNEVRVDAEGILARLPELAFTLDEPTADPAPLFVEDICARARADGLKLLMSGTGGDDVMTGYRRHVTARLRQYLGVLHGPAGCAAGMAAKVLPAGAKRRRAQRLAHLLGCGETDFLREAFMTNSQPDAWRLMHPELQERVVEGWHNDIDSAIVESEGQDVVNRMLYNELFGFLPDHNLNYADKAGMKAMIEIRVPFTDRRVMNFMADVAPTSKMRFLDAKAMFKASQRGRIPDSVINRSKSGFGAPIRSWLTGAGRGLVEDTLFGTSGVAAELFDRAAVEAFWQRVQRGETDGAYTMLALCMVAWGQKTTR